MTGWIFLRDRATGSPHSLLLRVVVITAKLLAVYVMSLKDAAFFYQQF